MVALRRVLDYLHLAPYPEWRPIRSGCELGLNVHLGSGLFEWMRDAAFTTAVLDYRADVKPDEYGRLLEEAQMRGLNVFIVGLPPGGAYAAAATLLSNWGNHIDYLCVRNEPDLKSQGYDGTTEEFALDILSAREAIEKYAPNVQLVAPGFSSLGPDSCRRGWGDKRRVLDILTKFGAAEVVDYVGLHVYKRTPDAALEYLADISKTCRESGWSQPVYVSELGWRSDHFLGRRAGEYRQALYLENTIARMSWLCHGVGVYVGQDDDEAGDTYGICRGDGRPKRAALALYRNRGL